MGISIIWDTGQDIFLATVDASTPPARCHEIYKCLSKVTSMAMKRHRRMMKTSSTEIYIEQYDHHSTKVHTLTRRDHTYHFQKITRSHRTNSRSILEMAEVQPHWEHYHP